MKGVIRSTGFILGENGRTYEPTMIYKDTILLSGSSWSRYPIKDVVGKEVTFEINMVNQAYNITLIE